MSGAHMNHIRKNDALIDDARMNNVDVQSGAAPVKASILKLTAVHVAKDLRLELRSRDVVNAMLFFAVLVVVVFSFSFDPGVEESRHMVGGLFWVAFLFSSIMALNQSWARELRNGVLDAFRVAPAPAEALFLGKCLGNFLLVGLLECLMVPLFIVFYSVTAAGQAWQLLVVVVLGTWALVVTGTFLAALSIRTKFREVMLPLVLLPVSIPAVVMMIEATTNILTGEASPIAQIKFLAVYCVIFTVVSFMLFETVLNAE